MYEVCKIMNHEFISALLLKDTNVIVIVIVLMYVSNKAWSLYDDFPVYPVGQPPLPGTLSEDEP